jgi:hypothetical protein
MFLSLFMDFSLSTLRILAATIHLISTGMLIWTKFDSIQVAMKDINDNEEFNTINNSFMTLLGFAVFFILFQLAFFLGKTPTIITLASVTHLALDVLACFMNFWIILDGLSWITYLTVWLICVLFPSIYDFVLLCVTISNRQYITRRNRGLFQRLYHWFYGSPVELEHQE